MKKLLLVLVSTATLIFASKAEATTLLLSDNFNNENNGVGILNYRNLNNWNITDGNIDLIGNGFFDFTPGNGLYLDLDGSTLNAGRIESKSIFSFNPGETINLTFDILGQNPQFDTSNNQVTVTLGNLLDETFSLDDLGTITRQIQVTSAETTNLIFDHAGGDNGGLLLDNVRLDVDSVRQTTPEPNILIGLFSLNSLCLFRKSSRKSS